MPLHGLAVVPPQVHPAHLRPAPREAAHHHVLVEGAPLLVGLQGLQGHHLPAHPGGTARLPASVSPLHQAKPAVHRQLPDQKPDVVLLHHTSRVATDAAGGARGPAARPEVGHEACLAEPVATARGAAGLVENLKADAALQSLWHSILEDQGALRGDDSHVGLRGAGRGRAAVRFPALGSHPLGGTDPWCLRHGATNSPPSGRPPGSLQIAVTSHRRDFP
mmetsp:Transcript_21755/g.60469  ORF Transcript_21755/g.60469 Transcript_21755/m.60469 type:complete len:220 (-) Transcript_21755:235-894(-)